VTSELVIFFSAITPVGELRAAIPLGVLGLGLPWPQVFLISILGNMLPVPILTIILAYLGSRVEHMDNPLGSLLRWRANQIRTKFKHLSKRYEILGIVLLVAIPLPFTGAWTASLAVWTLGISPIRGIPAILAGIVIAGVIVMALVLTGTRFAGIIS
jgi:uncharacterized membrane protein